jgi:UDP-N-acetylglucosamine diphosphorylase / glucose-1-phosphate thymidylyltransferase / UDP-N-acetylgalactosamine diphosphorylase / glucosamine-1-phosphate N-acetyltransferase / galactosamine-1-phosphate N-acetyltransferase
MKIILFEDDYVEQLQPITLARPAYAISCGSYRLVDWISLLPGSKQGVVREYLTGIQRTDFPELCSGPPTNEENILYVNARLVPSRSNFRILSDLLAADESHVVRCDDQIAALRTGVRGPRPASYDRGSLNAFLHSNGLAELLPYDSPMEMLRYPHDIVRANQQSLPENLDFRIQQGEFREVAEGVFLAEGAALSDPVVTDSRGGPILLDRGAHVGPFSYLSGPAYIGPRSRLIEHASIKDSVSIGHTVKIGGEVEASVIEPYTNKQHYGFLGHSYLGSWINLGAGTCNSDLKNTYGKINMDYATGRVATGQQFVGCIMGDYSKSAINTGIFTGKTIGVCSMLYGFVTTNVPSFVNYARLFGQVTELPPEVMVATQQRMFLRRQVTPRPCDQQLIQDMYELTRGERQISGDQLSL